MDDFPGEPLAGTPIMPTVMESISLFMTLCVIVVPMLVVSIALIVYLVRKSK